MADLEYISIFSRDFHKRP